MFDSKIPSLPLNEFIRGFQDSKIKSFLSLNLRIFKSSNRFLSYRLLPVACCLFLLPLAPCLLPLASHAQTFDPVPVQSILEKGFASRWLLCGPFPPGVQGGMMGMLLSQKVHVTDTDFLSEHGGEMNIKPQPGMTHTSAVTK